MKVPLSWLNDFTPVDLPDAEAVAAFAEFLSRHGLEVEEVANPGAGTDGVVTARVLSWEPHPNADKLRVVQITHGSDQVELVCGASNFDTGDVVVHAGPGSSIPGMTMAAKELRGVVSNGMLASARELQVGEDGDGIMILAPDTPLGADICDLLPLGEPVIEISGKGIRADHQSILGVARDVAALKDQPLDEPMLVVGESGDAVTVDIRAADGCSHFVVHAVGDVQVGASSPWWVRQRLAQCGVRSISPIVDITNLVMLELGQPLHAYDLDLVAGAALGVRTAREGEVVVTLDDVERTLVATDLVVIDGDDVAIGLAGVMGGASTEVSASTRRVAFEAAIWNPDMVRDTSRRLRLLSEASNRFERGVDPAGAQRAMSRAVELLGQVGSYTDLGMTQDGTAVVSRPTVTVDAGRLSAFIGLDELTADRQEELLTRVGCDVRRDSDELLVIPPSWRVDLRRFADVAEEVARLHGFDHIPATIPETGVAGGRTPRQQARSEASATARAAGLHEVVTRPFVGEGHLQAVLPTASLVELSNPLAQDASALRPSLAEGLLGAVRRNVGQGRPGVGLYEIASIFRTAGDTLDDVLDATVEGDWRWRDPEGKVLPTQPITFALALQGRRHGPGWVADDQSWSVLDALAIVDDVVAAGSDRTVTSLERRPVERPGFHPGRTAALYLDGQEVGLVGQLHPEEADERDLPDPVIVGELLLDVVLARATGTPLEGTAVVTHPAITVDVAVLAEDRTPWRTIESAIRDGAGDLLEDLQLFDVYADDRLGEGRRSLAARLRLQSADRQLTGDDEQAVLTAVQEAVARIDGASMRT